MKYAPKRACGQCDLLRINGVVCHETGCPEAWRNETRACRWCGSGFRPEGRYETCCSPCCAAALAGNRCECSSHEEWGRQQIQYV